MLALLFSTALAAEGPGHYHPDDIAAASQVMGDASGALSATFEARSTTLERVASALRQYREGLELLGARAPAAEWDRLAELEKRFHREQAVLQAFANEVVSDFDGVMTAAMQRAVSKHGAPERCLAEVPVGPRVPGMRARTQPNPECTGADLNPAIATAMDADATLRRNVDEIAALAWPEITVEAQPQAVGGAGSGHVSVRALIAAATPQALAAIDHQDDDLRLDVDAALEQESPDLTSLKARVVEIEQITARARSDLGGRVLGLAEARMATWKGGGPVGWCANPELLGGCEGPDHTGTVVDRLLADKKFAKKAR